VQNPAFSSQKGVREYDVITQMALVGFQGLMLAWAFGRLNSFIRLLKNNAFKDDAGRANRVVRHGSIHDPGIQQEPSQIPPDAYENATCHPMEWARPESGTLVKGFPPGCLLRFPDLMRLRGDSQAFRVCVLAFLLSVGLQWTQKATWSGGEALTRHTPEVRVRLGGIPIWRMRKNVVTP